jgi:trk system potassium uptake protein TrkA
MKIIIVGIGKSGSALAKQLSDEKHDVVVIDQNPKIIENIVNVYDVMGVCGNGACYSVQEEAGARNADLLIATASRDEINILSCLIAKKLGVKHIVARIRDPEYEKQLRMMRDDFGLSMIINPEKVTAREISRVLRFPNAVKLEAFSKGRIELVEYRIENGSLLDGIQLSSLYKNLRARVLICAVVRGGETTIPSGDFVLKGGDRIHLTASPKELEQFFRHVGGFKGRASSVMIVGASRMCYYLARELTGMGTAVKIIDRDEAKCIELGEKLPKAMVIHGDGTDNEMLQEEGIAETDAFVAISGIDEANILMAISAAHKSGCKVVAKINRQSLIDLVNAEHMIDSVVSAASVTTELILQYIKSMRAATGSQIKTLHRIAGGAVEALEFGVSEGNPCTGVQLAKLPIKEGILIAGIVRRGGGIVIPSGQDVINPGDDVIVVTTRTGLQDLKEILK